MICIFKPVRVEHRGQVISLRPFETGGDLDFLINGGIDRAECVRTDLLVPYKLVDLVGFDVPQSCHVLVGKEQVNSDKTLVAPRHKLDLKLELIDWETAIEPGDRLVFISNEDLKPCWDRTVRRLSFYEKEVKTLRNSQATNVITVLSSFDDDGWPQSIYDPLSGTPGIVAKKRLEDTVAELNKNHVTPGLISFHTSNNSTSVYWQHHLGSKLDDESE